MYILPEKRNAYRFASERIQSEGEEKEEKEKNRKSTSDVKTKKLQRKNQEIKI